MEQNSKEGLMSVKLDWTFKELMLKEEIRNSFMGAVLNKKIKSSKVLNINLRRDYADDRLGILDVIAELEDGTGIDIEMQVVPFKEWLRTLFYTSKMYVERSEACDQLNIPQKFINISVLDFIYLSEKEFVNSFHIRNDKIYKMYTDKMSFYLIELPKIPKEIESLSDLVLWAKFINSSSDDEMKMLATKSENIEIAYKELKRLKQDKEKRMEYEARQKVIRDYKHLMYQSKQEGIKEGRKKGFDDGEKLGINKGMELGLKQCQVDIAKKLLLKGFNSEEIMELTDLPIKQIKIIQQSL